MEPSWASVTSSVKWNDNSTSGELAGGQTGNIQVKGLFHMVLARGEGWMNIICCHCNNLPILNPHCCICHLFGKSSCSPGRCCQWVWGIEPTLQVCHPLASLEDSLPPADSRPGAKGRTGARVRPCLAVTCFCPLPAVAQSTPSPQSSALVRPSLGPQWPPGYSTRL